MNILQFGRFWGDVHGGVERHVASLLEGLSLKGHNIFNIVASKDGVYREIKYFNATVIEVPSFGKMMSTALSPQLIKKAIELHRSIKFDIFHFHYPDPLSSLASLLIDRKVPRIITWHSDIIRQKRALKIYRPLLNFELRRSKYIVAATSSHFSSSEQIPLDIRNNIEKCRVIPYGFFFDKNPIIDSNIFDKIKKDSRGRIVIFSLGRLVYYKGFEILIDAASLYDCVVYIGGSGPLKDFLQEKIKEMNLSDRVHLLGSLSEIEVNSYMHAADVFCLPSVEKSEAFGIVQVEAMAFGTPLLTSYLGNGVNEVGIDGETGLFFKNKNSKDLAEKIEFFDKNRLNLMEMSRNCKDRVNFFDMDRMIEMHEEIYRNAVFRAGNTTVIPPSNQCLEK